MLVLSALLLAAEAARPRAVSRLGILSPGDAELPLAETLQALRERGWVEGTTLEVNARHAAADLARLPELARELARLKPDVVLAVTSHIAKAVTSAAPAVPVVCICGDPVRSSLAGSLARPGGRVTGVALQIPELLPQRLELLRDLAPDVRVVAVLLDPPSWPMTDVQWRLLHDAARSRGIRLVKLVIPSSGDVGELFARAGRERARAVIPSGSPLYVAVRDRLVGLAERHRMVAVYEHRLFVEAGGLVSYGPHLGEAFRRAGYYLDRVLRGARPADLPIEQVDKIEMVVNLKAA
jgi:putative ABC transport system substrate-binding protein